jgi:hypothetical protein
MRTEIVSFIKDMNKKYGFEAIYLPVKDLYCIRYRGRGIQNFDTKRFYQLPKQHREKLLHAILKVGLNHNLGEKTKGAIYQNRSIGQQII